MFRHYLTYSFAQKYFENCQLLDIPIHVKRRLMRSAETAADQLSKACQSQDQKTEAMYWAAAYLNLKDCQEIMDQNGLRFPELRAEFEVVFKRVEILCLKSAEAEGGQLRLLG